jgi:hypothetical protein
MSPLLAQSPSCRQVAWQKPLMQAPPPGHWAEKTHWPPACALGWQTPPAHTWPVPHWAELAQARWQAPEAQRPPSPHWASMRHRGVPAGGVVMDGVMDPAPDPSLAAPAAPPAPASPLAPAAPDGASPGTQVRRLSQRNPLAQSLSRRQVPERWQRASPFGCRAQ